MAYANGTASTAAALFQALIDFLTTNTDLAAESPSQVWTLQRRDTFSADASRDFAELVAPGLAGTDSIYVQLQYFKNVAASTYSIRAGGSQSYLDSVAVNTPENQPGALNASGGLGGQAMTQGRSEGFVPRAPIIDAPMDYWFVANGRRAIVTIKSGNLWGSMYLGFYLPYGSPDEYPYPLYIAANSTMGDYAGSNDANVTSSAFWFGGNSPGAFFLPGGGWIPSGGINVTLGGPFSAQHCALWPWARGHTSDNTANVAGSSFALAGQVKGPDDTHVLLPAVVFSRYSTTNPNCTFGEMEGVFYATANDVSPGDVILIDSINYLMAPRGTQQNPADFAAIRLS